MSKIQSDKSIFTLVALMVVITAVIIINRSAHFFEPRTWIGYLIYAVFAFIFFLVLIAVIKRMTDYFKTKNQTEKVQNQENKTAPQADKTEPKE